LTRLIAFFTISFKNFPLFHIREIGTGRIRKNGAGEFDADSYVIRVCRRGIIKSGSEIAGLAEEVGTHQRQPFQTLSELISTIRQIIERTAGYLLYAVV
jgi:hypothetical protein